MKLKVLWKVFSKGVVDNLPTILSVVAVGGLVGSVATAIIDTPKAVEKIEEAKMEKAEKIEREAETDEEIDIYRDETGHLSLAKIKLSPWEYVTVLAPIYWKTGACVLLTGTCILMSNHVSNKRIAMLLAALKLKDKDLKEYENKIKEMFGEKKAEEVKQGLVNDKVMNLTNDEVIQCTRRGTYLCYDKYSQTWFRSTIDAVKSAVLNINDLLQAKTEVSVTDWCCELDIELFDTWLTDRIYWKYHPNKNDRLELSPRYASHPVTGEPCIFIELNRDPDIW